MLSDSEFERYSRHILLDEVGEAGQLALKDARVLIVGIGGLGSPVATYLAAAGVGTIGLVDNDVVELSNLQRQILFSEENIGGSKVAAAATRLKASNSNITVEIVQERLSAANAAALIANFDLVVDCSDNFATRYAINDACLALGRPFIYGSIYRFEGQVSVFCQPGGPCYRCLFPHENAQVANCAEVGVVGVLAGVIGSLQATEALKMLLGIGESLVGRLLLYDALTLDFSVVKLPASANCACLSQLVKISVETNSSSSKICASTSITALQLKQRLEAHEELTLLDVRTLQETRVMRFRASEHIEGATLEQRFGEVSPQSPVVVYCRSGIRSLRACRLLRNKGYSDVLNLSGGILAWYREFQDHLLESDSAIL